MGNPPVTNGFPLQMAISLFWKALPRYYAIRIDLNLKRSKVIVNDVQILSAVIPTAADPRSICCLNPFIDGTRLLAFMFIYIFHPRDLQLLTQKTDDYRIMSKNYVVPVVYPQDMHMALFWFVSCDIINVVSGPIRFIYSCNPFY